MTGFKTFETERLILRPTSETDAEFILELMNTPKWIKYIGDRDINTIKEAEEYIHDKMTPQLKRLGFSNYTVIRKSDDIKLGACGLYDREGLDDIDIGFAFLPQYEGRGYALESSKRIKEAAKKEFSIKRLCAITTKDNHSSQRLLEKLGFELKGSTKLPNDEEELFVYKAIL